MLQEISIHPQCINDMSFFLAEDKPFHTNEFYEIVRNVGGDFVEQVFVSQCAIVLYFKVINS